jgi:pyruvate dehydrogenase E1 component beta subunit
VRAVCEIEFFDFVGVAMDQIFNHAAKLHYFTGGKLRVPLVIRTPVVSRIGMGPQHSQSLESWFMHIPGIKVAIPSNASDAYGLLRTALRDDNPVLFVENVRLYGRRAEVDLAADPIPFGSAWVAREGSDATVVALSNMVDESWPPPSARRARDLGRGDRSADDRSPRPGNDPRLGTQTMRGVAHDAHKTGLRRRARGADHGGGVRRPRRTGRAGRRADVPIPARPAEWPRCTRPRTA